MDKPHRFKNFWKTVDTTPCCIVPPQIRNQTLLTTFRKTVRRFPRYVDLLNIAFKYTKWYAVRGGGGHQGNVTSAREMHDGDICCISKIQVFSSKMHEIYLMQLLGIGMKTITMELRDI